MQCYVKHRWLVCLTLVSNCVVVYHARSQTSTPIHTAQPLVLALPTENTALLRGDGPAFYQYTDRAIRPGFDMPWMGGRYGFVRNGVQTSWGILYPRFHEGIDIRPMARSARGEPLDVVRSIADGIVVHTNHTSRYSSYGKYVVVEHWWHGSSFYSLYAHLNAIHVEPEQPIVRGTPLGLLGYTGTGINRRRAHVHLEVNLLLNRGFQACYDTYFPDEENHHGLFNGLNMAGVDVSKLYLRSAEDPSYSVQQLLEETQGFFRVSVPAAGMLDILWRYPWLSPALRGWLPEFGAPPDLAVSWQITFSQSGIPLRIEASEEVVEVLELEVLQQTSIPYRYLTNGLLTGSGSAPELTRTGQRLVDFLLCPPPDPSDFPW